MKAKWAPLLVGTVSLLVLGLLLLVLAYPLGICNAVAPSSCPASGCVSPAQGACLLPAYAYAALGGGVVFMVYLLLSAARSQRRELGPTAR